LSRIFLFFAPSFFKKSGQGGVLKVNRTLSYIFNITDTDSLDQASGKCLKVFHVEGSTFNAGMSAGSQSRIQYVFEFSQNVRFRHQTIIYRGVPCPTPMIWVLRGVNLCAEALSSNFSIPSIQPKQIGTFHRVIMGKDASTESFGKTQPYFRSVVVILRSNPLAPFAALRYIKPFQ